jgi:hypothetical protein
MYSTSTVAAVDQDSPTCGLADGAHRQVGWYRVEIEEFASERVEAGDVALVGSQPKRGPHGTPGGQSDRVDLVIQRHPFAELAAHEPLTRDRECDFAGTRIAKASGPQRDHVLARNTIDEALVDDAAVRMEEVEGDGGTAFIGGAGGP